MRAAAAVLAVLALAAICAAWRMSLGALEEQAKIDAEARIATAGQVMSLREDKRLETLMRAAAELQRLSLFAPESRERIGELLGKTSFGESLNSAVLVGPDAELLWAGGGAASGPVKLEVVTNALAGSPGMALLPADDAAVLSLKQTPRSAAVMVVAAPVSAAFGTKVAGALVVVEPVQPDFFQHLASLTKVGVSLSTPKGEIGALPKEAVAAAGPAVSLIESTATPLFVQRLSFRVRGVVVGEAVGAADASGFVRRKRSLTLWFGGALLATVAVALLSLRRRP